MASLTRVPVYLRYEGQVKNLHIDAKMTAEMIADLLRAKEEAGQQDVRMSDFLLQFISLRYSTTTLQMEFSYNLVDGIDRFKVCLLMYLWKKKKNFSLQFNLFFFIF